MRTAFAASRPGRLLLSALSLPVLAGGALFVAQTFRAPSVSAALASDPAALAKQIASGDAAPKAAAVARLRAMGPAGFRALLTAYDAAPGDRERGRLRDALDAVARQKDSHASRLFWYTDTAAAKRAAKASGKPILSLRLLGNLDDELSCANSRFFRTTLYPDAAVSAYLRDHYVLHWSSERPVPVFTLDFGDGRKVVRTLTGNSIHYVLDAGGRPVDALPGLYGPKAFVRVLREAESLARESAAMPSGAGRQARLAEWHRARFDVLTAAWKADSAKVYGEQNAASVPELSRLIAGVGAPKRGAPGALDAAPLAAGKSAGELPVVEALKPGDAWAVGPSWLDWAWDEIGQLHADDARLDARARALIAAKKPDLTRVSPVPVIGGRRFRGVSLPSPGGLSVPPLEAGAPAMAQLIANFERAMAQDTARNEYVFHAALHRWFVDGRATGDLATLNRRVYRDLFLTPSEDPWLGLAPGVAYVALPDDGLIGANPAGPPASHTARR